MTTTTESVVTAATRRGRIRYRLASAYPMRPYQDLGELLAEGGAVVGGSAALCGTTAFVFASIARDLGFQQMRPLSWAEQGAHLGGVIGLVAWLLRLAGVH